MLKKVKKENWWKFQELIAEKFREIAPFARSTKASGGSTEKGDLTNIPGLHCEMKDYNKDSVYQEKWMQKVIEEVPLHVQRIPVLFTRNKDGKIRAHLEGDDFIKLYIEHFKAKKFLESLNE